VLYIRYEMNFSTLFRRILNLKVSSITTTTSRLNQIQKVTFPEIGLMYQFWLTIVRKLSKQTTFQPDASIKSEE
jgi:hypothetical protein